MHHAALAHSAVLGAFSAYGLCATSISLAGLRTDKEKESAGVPDIPVSGRLIELEYAAISDRKIRGQLRNPGEIEKTVHAPRSALLCMHAHCSSYSCSPEAPRQPGQASQRLCNTFHQHICACSGHGAIDSCA